MGSKPDLEVIVCEHNKQVKILQCTEEILFKHDLDPEFPNFSASDLQNNSAVDQWLPAIGIH